MEAEGPEILAAGVLALLGSGDEGLAGLAEALLARLGPQHGEVIDALVTAAPLVNSAPVAALCARVGYAPEDPELAMRLRVISEQWAEVLSAQPFPEQLLADFARQVSPSRREQLADALAAHGGAEALRWATRHLLVWSADLGPRIVEVCAERDPVATRSVLIERMEGGALEERLLAVQLMAHLGEMPLHSPARDIWLAMAGYAGELVAEGARVKPMFSEMLFSETSETQLVGAYLLLAFRRPEARLDYMEEPSLDELAVQLASPQPAEIARALVGLQRMGEKAAPAVDVLVGLLGDTRQAPLDPALSGLREGESTEINRLAGAALVSVGSAAVDALLPLAESTNETVRSVAMGAMLAIADTRLAGFQLRVLQGGGADEARSTAARSLGASRHTPAVPALVRVALSDQRWVREAALKALRDMGSGAVPELAGLLSESLPQVQRLAADLLGDIDDPLARAALLQAAERGAPAIRGKAIEALGRSGDPSLVGFLIGLLDDRARMVRWSAGDALAAIGEPAVEPLVLDLGAGGERDRIRMQLLRRITAANPGDEAGDWADWLKRTRVQPPSGSP